MDSALFGISVTNFVYYYWYEWTRAFFENAAAKAGRATKKLTTVESMIAGAIAGSATVIITNPIWVINTRMTTRGQVKPADEESGAGAEEKAPAKPRGTIATLLALLKEEGPKALFAGVVPALVLVINPILQYTLFEQMKNSLEKKRRITPTMAFFLGAISKLFSTTITYPYITVKSQMHVAGASGNKEGMMQTIRRLMKEEGYAGLYKGMCLFSPRRLHSALSPQANAMFLFLLGIGPKVTQSVLTAAFLFAFKDALYTQTIRLRLAAAKKA